MFQEIAKAKINLTLKVNGKRKTGYHELISLVAFADFGDIVSYKPNDEYTLSVSGPYKTNLIGENLIDKTTAYLSKKYDIIKAGELHLIKNLPVGSGIGGGSADAAAVLRILSNQITEGINAYNLTEISNHLGADIPVCLKQRAAFMTGIGESISVLNDFPITPCLLVNPGVHVSTADIFKALNAKEITDAVTTDKALPNTFTNIDLLIAFMKQHQNDLQKITEEKHPEISEVLSDIQNQPGCIIARMSGSGSTCFGLFESQIYATQAHKNITAYRPTWWAKSGKLS